MADIVDAFVVSLGLDPTNYNDEMKKYRADRKKLASEDETYQRREQDGSRKTVEGLRKLRNETAGFLALLAGANSIGQFVGNLMTGDAATGRFAANIGMATERVSAWENAIKRVGGTSQEAQGNLRALASIFQNYTLGTDFSKRADLAYFGLTERDLENPENALMQLHEKGQNLNPRDRQIYTNRLNRLGLSDSMVTLLSKPTSEFKAMMADIEKLGTATDETAKAAMTLDEEMAKTAQSLQGAVRPALSDITEAFKVLTELVRDHLSPAIKSTIEFFKWFGFGKDSPRDEAGNSRPGYRKVPVGPAWMGIYKDEKIPVGTSGGSSDALGAANQMLAGLGFAPIAIPSGAARPAGPRGKLTRAERNNNPGNIEDGKFARSQPGYAGGDGRFAKFATAEAGFAAMEALLLGRGYMGGGRNTISSIIAKYAPSSENNVGAYASAVERATGINRNATLSASQIRAVSRAMARHEGYRGGSVDLTEAARSQSHLRRPAAANRGGSAAVTNTTNVGDIVIYTNGKDAETIARDMRVELQKRGLVVQASSGLKP